MQNPLQGYGHIFKQRITSNRFNKPEQSIENSQQLRLIILAPDIRHLVPPDIHLKRILHKVYLQLNQKIPLVPGQIRIHRPFLKIGMGPKDQNLTGAVRDPKDLLPLLDENRAERDAGEGVSRVGHLLEIRKAVGPRGRVCSYFLGVIEALDAWGAWREFWIVKGGYFCGSLLAVGRALREDGYAIGFVGAAGSDYVGGAFGIGGCGSLRCGSLSTEISKEFFDGNFRCGLLLLLLLMLMLLRLHLLFLEPGIGLVWRRDQIRIWDNLSLSLCLCLSQRHVMKRLRRTRRIRRYSSDILATNIGHAKVLNRLLNKRLLLRRLDGPLIRTLRSRLGRN